MGLRTAVIFFIPMLSIGCAGFDAKTPADRVKDETFRFNCCDPYIGYDAEWWCEQAMAIPGHAFTDIDGNVYEYAWPTCEKGREPWRN